MASNGNPQSERFVFPLQSNVAAAEAGNAAVRQDKARISSARIGTRQPAPETKRTRARQLNPNTTRSHPLSNQHQRAVKVTAWCDPIVKAELQRIAAQEGLTLSAVTSALLKQALRQHVDLQYSALLEPIIRHEIQQQMQGISNRLAWLLARNAFSSEQTRAIAANILGRQGDMTEEKLKHILARTKRTAHGILTRRNPEVEELIAAVKQWLDHDEQEPVKDGWNREYH